MRQEPYEKTVTKNCIACNSEFAISGIVSGSGTHSKFSKIFCRNECKRLFKKRNTSRAKVSPVELTCKICGLIFYLPPSQAKTASTCSNECRHQLNSVHHSYSREQRTCVSCNATFECIVNSTQKFCSSMCAKKPRCERVTKLCVMCNVGVTRRLSQFRINSVVTCGKKCQSAAQSAGLIQGHVSGRSGYRIDINDGNYYKSALEADFARYCIAMNTSYVYEHKTFAVDVCGIQRHYTPDFYLPNTDSYIELKGIKPNSDETRRLIIAINSNIEAACMLSEQGINIEIIYQVDFHKLLKNSGMWKSMPILETRNHRMHKDVIVKRIR